MGPFEKENSADVAEVSKEKGTLDVSDEKNSEKNSHEANRHELIVIDSTVDKPQELVEALQPKLQNHTAVLLLKPGSDGLHQITEALETLTTEGKPIDGVHIISHAKPGSFSLGSESYSADDFLTGGKGTHDTNAWRPYLAHHADILLYGCDLAANTVGLDLIEKLSLATGADIAASTDTTGTLEGNWVLEAQTGVIETSTLTAPGYTGTLPASDFGTTDYNGDGTADPLRMITWNVIGLDSNKPTTSGPNLFMVGIRVEAGTTSMAGYTVKIVEDDNVDIFSSGLTIGDVTGDGADGVDNVNFVNKEAYTGVSISSGGYKDFYFNAEVLRSLQSHDQLQPFHFEVFKDTDADGVWDGAVDTNGDGILDTAGTGPGAEEGRALTKFSWLPDANASNTPLYLYVEHYISQARNDVTDQTYPNVAGANDNVAAIRVAGYTNVAGTYPNNPITVFVGSTLNIRVEGETATQGYPQLTVSTVFDTDVFQITGSKQFYDQPITTTTFQQGLGTGTDSDSNFDTASPSGENTSIYANPAGWNPATHSTMITSAPPKAGGGPIITDYTVQVTGTGSGRLDTLILDYSGSSFHYNADLNNGVDGIDYVRFNSVYGAIVGNVSPTGANTPAVTVTLYRDSNNDGVADGAALATTTTNTSTGNYVFTGLTPDRYLVIEGTTNTNYTDLTDTDGLGNGPNKVSVNLTNNPSIGTAGDLGVNGLAGSMLSATDLLGYARADFYESSAVKADLELTMAVDKTAPLVGETVTYTITVVNQGPENATNVRVTDVLPAGVTYVSSDAAIDADTSKGGSYAGNLWTIGSLAKGETATLTISTTAATAGSVTNYAEITNSDQSDIDSTPNNASTTEDDDDSKVITIAARPANADVELSLVMVDGSGNPFTPGQIIPSGTSFKFIVTAYNYASANTQNAYIFLDIPDAGVTWGTATQTTTTAVSNAHFWFTTVAAPTSSANWGTEVTTNGGAITAGTKFIRWTPDDSNAAKLAAGKYATLTITGTTTSSINLASGNFRTAAWWADYGLAAAQKDYDSAPTGNINDTTITANGPDRTDIGGAANDDTPVDTAFPANGNPNDDDEAVINKIQVVDLSIAKGVSNSTPNLGDTVTFTLTVSNASASVHATGVTILDTLPAGLTGITNISSSGVYNSGAGTITWTNLGVLASGTKTLTFDATVSSAAALQNIVDITAANQTDVDDTFGDATYNEDRATVSVDAKQADLSLSKTANTPTWNATDGYYTVDFTLTVSNSATSDNATGVKVKDLLPAGLVWLSDNSSGAYDTGTGFWTVGALNGGASKSITITARVNTPSAVTNYAQVTASNLPDPDSQVNNNSGPTPVQDDEAAATVDVALVDLSLTKTITGAEPTLVGQSITYVVVLRNGTGFDQASGIQVTETIPTGLSGVVVTPGQVDGSGNFVTTGGIYAPTSNTYASGVWSVSELPSGMGVALRVTGTVTNLSLLNNIAEVTAVTTGRDVDSTPNNRATAPSEDDVAEVRPSGLALITGKVQDDKYGAKSGLFDPGDERIAGVTVQLLNAAGNTVLQTTTTDANGAYSFYAVAGSYVIRETNLNGTYEDVMSRQSSNPLTGAITPGTNPNEITITVAAGSEYYENNFLDRSRNIISGTVFNDVTGTTSGNFDGTDSGIAGVTVNIYRITSDGVDGKYGTNDDVVSATPALTAVVTDLNGDYTFQDSLATPLTNGYYRIVETDLTLPGYTSVRDIEGNTTTPGYNFITVKIDKNNTTGYKHTDGVTGSFVDGNGQDRDFLDTVAIADLSISKSPSSATATVGDVITWTITVTNASLTTTATGVSVEDIVPAGYTSIGTISNGGSLSGSTITWNGLTIGANSSITLTFQATVTSTNAYTNVTQITDEDQYDPDSTPNNLSGTPDEDDEDDATITVDYPPTITITDNNGGAAGDESVREDLTLTGKTFTISAVDGLNKIVVEGTNVTAAQLANAGTTPIAITTAEGTLTITGYNAGTGVVTYNYDPAGTSKNHTAGDNTVIDAVDITVHDSDGDTASGTLDILITDTAPTANADTNTANENGSAVTGNVRDGGVAAGDVADTLNPDTPVTVTAASQGVTSITIGSAFTTAAGGTLTLNANGTYSYTPPSFNNVPPAGLTETFNYTITDSDGDTSTTTLTITVNDVDRPPTITITDNNGGAAGDESVREDLSLTGKTFTISAPDGLDKIVVEGTDVTAAQLGNAGTTPIAITTAEGTLTITGYNAGTGVVTYNYDPAGTSKNHTAGDNTVIDSIDITVRDSDGDTVSDTLDILITDTTPTANADTNTANEGGSAVTGNVRNGGVAAGDVADTLNPDTPVTVTAASQGATPITIGSAFTTAAGGTLTLNANGTYSYTPPSFNNVPPAGLTETFNYTITDSDGDTSTTTLTITVNDVDRPPTITITDNNGGAAGDESVREDLTLTGKTFTISAPDGLDKIVVEGTDVTAAQLGNAGTTPIAITTAEGVLTITGYNAGTGVVTYNYDPAGTSKNHTAGDSTVIDSIDITVRDSDGDTVSDTLDILITDTAPTANADTNTANENGSAVTGNVRNGGVAAGDVADTLNPDTPVTVTAASQGATPITLGSAFTTAAGGTLTLNANGTYSYTPPSFNNVPPAGLTETFNYTITDSDGDTSTTTLTITVNDVDRPPTITITDNNGGAAGDESVREDLSLTGKTFTISAPDGLDKIVVEGTDVTAAQLGNAGTTPIAITTAEGVLTITGYNAGTGVVTYNYDPAGTSKNHTTGDNTVIDSIDITVRDSDGDTVSDTLDILITDTTPTANADTNTANEGGSAVTGNVRNGGVAAGDVADTLNPDTPVTVTAASQGVTSITIGSAFTTAAGGTLTLNANGTYSYTPPSFNNVPPAGLTETFNYTITDSDGDTSTTTLTITVNDVDRPPTITITDNNGGAAGDESVREDLTLTGKTFTISAPDGLDKIVVEGTDVTAAQLGNAGTTPIAITTAEGVLTITGYNAGTGVVTYNYDPAGTSKNHTAGDNTVIDSIDITVRDSDGDTVSDTLDILITDTTPTANADTNTANEGGSAVTGNVRNGGVAAGDVADTLNPDTPVTVTAASQGATPITIGSAFTTAAGGTLTLNANGTYSYTPPSFNNVPPAGLTETFNYTITDSDGDTSTTTLTITVNDVDRPPTITIVDNNGGAAGDESVREDLTLTGKTFTITAPDGLDKIVVEGTDVTAAQLGNAGTTPIAITTAEGTLTITGYNAGTGVVTYNYDPAGTSKNHTAGDNTVIDAIDITVHDSDGDTASGTLDILITDTTPTANADTNTANENGSAVTGNVRNGGVAAGDVADTLNPDTPVTVTAASQGVTSITIGSAFTTAAGGTLTLNANGTYSYTPPSFNNVPPAGLTETFNYTITDSDGDTSTTTLTITVNDVDRPPTITITDNNGGAAGDESVREDLTLTGKTFTITAPDGLDKIVVEGTDVTAAQLGNAGTTPIAITTAEGILTITGYNAGTGVVTYDYNPAGTSKNHTAGDNTVIDAIDITVHDADGDTASGTLDILITDTTPTANSDTNTAVEGGPAVNGNVRDGGVAAGDVADSLNPDTPVTVTAASQGATPITIGSAFTTSAGGTLTLNANGTYSYTPPGNGTVPPAGLIETFNYTITDSDGDTSTATLTITVGDSDRPTTITIVDNNGGAAGDESVREDLTLTGKTFTISAPDGLDKIVVEGTDVTAAQLGNAGTTPIAITTAEGILTITGYNAGTGVVTYNYDPAGTRKDHSGGDSSVIDSIDISVIDTDGDSSTGTLDILITDTAPTANADTNTANEGGSAVTGNVRNGGVAAGDVADTLNVDTPVTVTGASQGATPITIGSSFTTAAGGTLTLNANGTYSYTPPSFNNVPPTGLTETFNYTITDSDGDTSTTTLTITVNDVDRPPTITIVDNNGGAAGDESVQEDLSLTGKTFTITAPDGLDKIVVEGTDVTAAQLGNAGTTPIAITTAEGTLTITGYNAGTGVVTYNYDPAGTSKNHTAGDNTVIDAIDITVHDADGDTASGTLDILITDTTPTANADTNTANEGGSAVTGNVRNGGVAAGDVADTLNPDTPVTVTGASQGATPITIGSAFTTAAGGTLTLNANGTYSYTPPSFNNVPPTGLTETFNYTITDSDGDTSTTTLTITVNDVDRPPTITITDNNGGAAGDESVREDLTLTGKTFTITAPDGLDKIVVEGTDVTAAQLGNAGTTPIAITTAEGVLTITGYNAGTGVVTYNYDPAGTSKNHTAGDNTVIDAIDITVHDSDGDTASGTLDILITDTTPTANADTNTANEGGSAVTGNVRNGGVAAGDVADTLNPDTPVTVTGASQGATPITIGSAFTTAAGGTLTLNANGTYSYTPPSFNNVPPTGLTETFNYTITDSDGDTSTTTLTITVNDVDRPPTITIVDNNGGAAGDESVREDLTLTGKTFTITAPDGLDKIVVEGTDVTAAQLGNAGTTPIAITTAEGILTITGYNAGTGVVTYNYDPAGTSKNHTAGDNTVIDAIDITVHDSDGDTASGTLDILITDTTPTANADTNTANEGGSAVTGNVRNGGVAAGDVADTLNTDTPVTVTAASQGVTSITIGSAFTTAAGGTLTLNANGTYSYTPPSFNNVPPTGLTETFNYTITDSDGDTSTTTLTITVNDVDRPPTITIVDNNGGAAGDESVREDLTLTGKTFTITAPDGLDKIVVEGTDVTAAQLGNAGTTPIAITTAEGVLTITGYNAGTGVVTYNYDPAGTSKNHTAGDNTVIDAIDITVHDADGDTASGTLDILITDTTPTANADTNTANENGSAVTGNVRNGGVAAGDVADTLNPDTPVTVTAASQGVTSITIGSAFTTAAGGTLTLNANGTYSYTPPSFNNVPPAGLTETFNYTITDSDGDTSTTTLTITVNDVDRPPTITIVDNNGGAAGDESVREDLTLSGKTFTITAPDGLDKIVVEGTDVTAAQLGNAGTTPIAITTAEGTLTITGYNAGTGVVTYNYDPAGTSKNHTAGDNTVIDAIDITVHDADGDTASGTLDILITDTTPTANADTNSANEGGSAVTGNVRNGGVAAGDVADTLNPDTPVTVTAASQGATPITIGSAFTTAAGGTLTLNANGTYSYTPPSFNNVPPTGLTETFNYTITDSDGDTSTTTLTITVNDVDRPPTITIVDNNGGAAGDESVREDLTLTGKTFTITAPDGLDKIVVEGTDVTAAQLGNAGTTPVAITTAEGILTITGYNAGTGVVTYNYDPAGTSKNHTAGDNTVIDAIDITVHDADGDTASGTLDILITDTTPTANADTNTANENGSAVTGNVRNGGVAAGDVADTLNPDTPVTVTGASQGATPITIGSAFTTAAGGTLTLNANGTYSYTPPSFNNVPPTGLTETFNYTITDSDGDTSTTTLTITVNDVDRPPTITITDNNGGAAGDESVREDLSLTGKTFTITAPDGLDKIVVEGTDVTAAQLGNAGTTPIAITTAEGVLTITGYNAGTGVVTYNYDPAGTSKNHTAGDNTVIDAIDITVHDSDGDTASGTLDILITDTTPTANADTNTANEGGSAVTGNVRNGGVAAGDVADTLNPDTPVTVTGASQGATPITIGSAFTTAAGGTLTLNANGTYSYTPPSFNNVPPAGLTETFNYTITDSDGDTSTTTLTITVNDVDRPPTITIVDNNGGAAGDESVREDLTLTGKTFTITAPDGLDKIVVEGTDVTAAQLGNAGTTPIAITTAEGILTITGYNGGTGVVTYSYNPTGTSKDHTNGDNSVIDTIDITVHDADGDTASGTLDILITDTAPTANSDTNTAVEGGSAVTGDVRDGGVAAGDVADNLNPDTPVDVTSASQGANPITIGSAFTTAAGGSITINADGSYSYTPPSINNVPPAGLTETFSYTITDSDGDTSTATLTITVNDSDRPTSITITDNNGGAAGDESVREDLTLTGKTFTISAPDGLSKIVVDGNDVTAAQLTNAGTTPIVITTTEGTLTITGYNAGTGVVTYNYDPAGSSKDHSAGNSSVIDSIGISVHDTDGDSSSGTLDILITDTAPTANADTNTAVENGSAVTGNVRNGGVAAGDVADTLNVDTPVTVTAASQGATPITIGSAFTTANGGTLTINANGTYSYTPPSFNNVPPAGLTETFNYTITDSDGDTSTTTLTITITDVDRPPTITITDNNGGAAGDESVREDLTLTGKTFTITAPDGLNKITVAGTDVTALQLTNAGTTPVTITTPEGTLTITGYNAGTGVVTYNYNPAGTSKDHTAGNSSVVDAISIVVQDADGDEASGTLDILITDTAPTANDDTNNAVEGGPAVNGNVRDGGVAAGDGADTLNPDTPVTVNGASQGSNPITIGAAFTTANGGTLTLNANGTYTYTPPANLPEGGTLTETFDYTITDSDGDTDKATLTITIDRLPDAVNDTNTAVEGGPGRAGNVITNDDEGNVNATVTGANQNGDAILFGSPYTTAAGGTIVLNANGTYTYTPPSTLPEGGVLTEVFNYTITDADGDTSAATLTITVNRLPDAKNDTNSAVEGGADATGNLITNDDEGNTNAGVSGANQNGNTITLGSSFTTDAGGTIVINANGTYTYTPPDFNDVPQGGLTEVFKYTITDANGDTSTAKLTITVTDGNADLVTIKTLLSSDSTPAEGDTVTFRITVTNRGDATATNVKLTDLLPDGLTFTDGSASIGSYNSTTGRWNIGSLLKDGSATLDITATVDIGQAGQAITNITTAAKGDQPDPDPTGDDLDETIVIPDNANLVTVKTLLSDDATPNEGDTVTFRITVTNRGGAQATNVSLSDVLPDGITFSDALASVGTYNSSTGLWTIGTLAKNGSVTLDLSGTVDVGAGGRTITNITTAADGDQPDSTDDGDDLDETVKVDNKADLVTVKTLLSDDSTPNEGDAVTFRITVTNNGAAQATNVTLTDKLPKGLTFSDDLASVGTYNSATGLWTIGTLAKGETVTLDLTATVDVGAGGKRITNNTTAADGDQPDPTDDGNDLDETVKINNKADLVTEKTLLSDDPTPNEGDTVTFRITVTNNGAAQATHVKLTDVLPDGLTFSGHLASVGTYDSATGLWKIGTVAKGESVTLDLSATVDVGAGGQRITNITTAATGDQPDPTDDGDDLDETVEVDNKADLATEKTLLSDDPTPNEGDTVTFRITVTNNGAAQATNVQLTDALPAGLTYLDDVVSAGSYDAETGVWTIGTLGRGESVTIDLTAVVNIGQGGNTITNVTTAATGDQPDPDPTGDDLDETITIPDTARPDLSIDIDDFLTRVDQGDRVTYHVTVTNFGDGEATNVVATTLLPDDTLEYLRDSLGNGVYFSRSGDDFIRWQLGTLQAGQTVTFTIDVNVLNGLPRSIDTVPVVANVRDDGSHTGGVILFDQDDDIDQLDFPERLDLAVTITDHHGQFDPGDERTYYVNAQNLSGEDAHNVVVTVHLPDGIDFVSAKHGGDFDPSTRLVTWNISEFGKNSHMRFDLNVQVDGQAENGKYTLDATIADDGSLGREIRMDNNRDADTNIIDLSLPEITLGDYFKDEFNDYQEHPMLQPYIEEEPEPGIRPILPLMPMYSGHAEPGSTIVIYLFNIHGAVIGTDTVVADAGGNWLAKFPSNVIYDHPTNVVETATRPSFSNTGEAGYNLRTYFSPAINPSHFFMKSLEPDTVFSERAENRINALKNALEQNDRLDWTGFDYEFLASPGAPSS